MHCSRGRGGLALSLSALAAALLAACGGGSTGTDAPTEGPAAAKAAAADIAIRARGANDGVSGGSVKVDGDRKASKVPNSKLYIVQLAEAPVAGYKGGIGRYAATKPARGNKIDSTAPACRATSATSRRGTTRCSPAWARRARSRTATATRSTASPPS